MTDVVGAAISPLPPRGGQVPIPVRSARGVRWFAMSGFHALACRTPPEFAVVCVSWLALATVSCSPGVRPSPPEPLPRGASSTGGVSLSAGAVTADELPALAAPQPAPRERATRPELVYAGTVADKRVLARLLCEGAVCNGYYFYEVHGEALELVSVGARKVGERARGVNTGSITFTSDPGGGTLNGTWISSDGNRSHSVAWNRLGSAGPARILVRRQSEAAKDAPKCREEIVTFEIAGLARPDIEQAINDRVSPAAQTVLLDPPSESDWLCSGENRCTPGTHGHTIRCSRDPETQHHAAIHVEVKYVDAALLSVARTSSGYGGGHAFYGVTGLNVDLARGVAMSPNDWVREPRAVDWGKLAHPDASTDGAVPVSGGRLGDSSDLLTVDGSDSDLLSLGYVTLDALVLIADVPDVDRDRRGKPLPIAWSKLRAHLRPDSPVSHLAR